MCKRLIFLSVFVLLISNLRAQDDNADYYASKYFNQAEYFYDSGEYDKAIKNYKLAIKYDKYKTKAYSSLGGLYLMKNMKDSLLSLFKKFHKYNSDKTPYSYIFLANAYILNSDYVKAKKILNELLAVENIKDNVKLAVNSLIKQCDFAIDQMANPVPFNPINLGDKINTEFGEYLPSISVDENVLVITVKKPRKKSSKYYNTGKQQEDFYISYKLDGEWQKASYMGDRVNTEKNEGAQTLSSDGKYMFFTACNRNEGLGSCDIYFTKRKGLNWLQPINIGPPVNTKYWEGQPSISADGNTLYYASDRPGGKGKQDIWMSEIDENGKFSKAVNLGDSINTKKNEMSPFIHADNITLYFASDGHLGMGNVDLFFARKKTNEEWSRPVNLGYPINTSDDELSLVVNSSGKKAYFSSDREGGYGDKDIYVFDLYEGARPNQTTYFKGKIVDSETKQALDTDFELIDIETGKIIMDSKSSASSGEFLLCLPEGRNYALNISKDGYLFYSDNFFLKKSEDTLKPYIKNIELQKIKVGAKIVLKNVFFETNKYNLDPKSKNELNKVYDLMSSNPDIIIEIGGHTDNVGKDNDNLLLSQNRAKAVYTYLKEKGVPSERMKYKGYGETIPISENSTVAGRALNRRTEFTILSK